MLDFGWFSTGRDEAARQLLETVHSNLKSGEIKGRIQFVFVSREPGDSPESDKFIALAQSYGLPVVTFSFDRFKARTAPETTVSSGGWPEWRTRYDQEVIKRLKGYSPQICIMAGYMLILSAEMCRHFNFLNLHPAVPNGPTGTWQEVMWKLIESRSTHAGAMMHLVTPELDRGPAVTFFKFPIQGSPFDTAWKELEGRSFGEVKKLEGENNRLFKLIRHYELIREFPLIVKTLKAFGDGRVAIHDRGIVDGHGRPIRPYDLSHEINKILAEVK
ncbi:MAG: formyltransferase family protein [Chloroflexota bacterium]